MKLFWIFLIPLFFSCNDPNIEIPQTPYGQATFDEGQALALHLSPTILVDTVFIELAQRKLRLARSLHVKLDSLFPTFWISPNYLRITFDSLHNIADSSTVLTGIHSIDSILIVYGFIKSSTYLMQDNSVEYGFTTPNMINISLLSRILMTYDSVSYAEALPNTDCWVGPRCNNVRLEIQGSLYVFIFTVGCVDRMTIDWVVEVNGNVATLVEDG